MKGIAWAPLGHLKTDLVVLDADRRLYAGLARDGSYYHVVQPARRDDPRVGDGLRRAGQLVCSCNGGMFRGTCYRVEEAERFEAHMDGPVWLESPAGAGEAVEAFRG